MSSMATTGKGKGKGKKTKGVKVSLDVFVADDSNAPQGFNVVNTRKLDWAQSMENEEIDDTFTLNYKRGGDPNKVLLPTAPKSTRGPDVDMAKVPFQPPFKAYLGNLPYDVSEHDINRHFQKLNIIDVRLPQLNGRPRGFAYAEFTDRQSLIDALTCNGDMFRNRQLRVGLPGDNDGSTRENTREEKTDRTAGDWRSAPREEQSDSNRETYQARNGSNSSDNMQRGRANYESGGYNNRTFEPSKDRGFERSNDSGFERSNDRGFERSNDRGYGGFDRSSNDRGFERSNDRGFDRSNDRGFERQNNRYGNRNMRYNDRNNSGQDRDDESDGHNRGFDRESNDRSYGRRTEDRRYNDNRNDNRREFGNFERRRDDSHYDRSSSPQESTEEQPKERRKLQLIPRSKPIETAAESPAVSSSAIFGGAKPVNTAARENEIEQKLLKEKQETDKKRENAGSGERIRRISASSNVSGNSRSRKGSDSGPSPSHREDSRDYDDNYKNNGMNRNSFSRQRKTSERSNASSDSAPKYIMTRNKDGPQASSQNTRIVSVNQRPQGVRGAINSGPNTGSNRYNNRRKDRDREGDDQYYRPPRMTQKSDEEEEKKVEYMSQNKFAHLTNEVSEDDNGVGGASD